MNFEISISQGNLLHYEISDFGTKLFSFSEGML